MSNELQVFKNEQFGEVRTLAIDGEPWFVGKDVAEILGYRQTADAIRNRVDVDDKGVYELSTPGGKQPLVTINESGLYSLILGSKLPTAKKFKRWVTSEVLPAIRKHGGYLTEGKIEEVLNDPDTIIRLATNLKAERERRRALECKVEQDKPKVLFAEAVETAKTSILIGDLAKILKQNGVDMGQNRLFEWMRGNGYLIKSGESKNMPTQYAMERGWFEVKESTILNPDGSSRVTRTTKVTGRGQTHFIGKFLGGEA